MKNTEGITFEGTVTLYQIGLAAGSRETLETVLEELDTLAKEASPDRRNIWMLRMDCLRCLRKWKELLELSFTLQEEFGQNDRELWRARAIAYEGLKRKRKCIETLDEALERFPGDPELIAKRESFSAS